MLLVEDVRYQQVDTGVLLLLFIQRAIEDPEKVYMPTIDKFEATLGISQEYAGGSKLLSTYPHCVQNEQESRGRPSTSWWQ
ncbi:hypothetical protein R1sor_014745 [Riccia sorocarpa]|uniref:Uncharacterized protein n=1 Tax=Riccia sorocarpa TaxID=122646 RepID=A0ABD3HEI2_9MARC